MKRLERITSDGQKLGDDFQLLGKHLSSANSSYESAGKRLTLLVDRVGKIVEIGDNQNEKKEELEAPKV